MKKLNKILAALFFVMACVAFYGAAFANAPWHYVTFIACAFIGMLFVADSQSPQTPGLSGK